MDDLEQGADDREWLVRQAVPSRWTLGHFEVDAAATAANRERLARLAADTSLQLDVEERVVEVRPIDVCEVPRLSPRRPLGREEPRQGYQDLLWTGGRARVLGHREALVAAFLAPTIGHVQQADVRLPGELGARLASMFVYVADGDLALVGAASDAFGSALHRGHRATVRVPDGLAGRRLLAALARVGLDHDGLDYRRSRPRLEGSSWRFTVQGSSATSHAKMFSAAADAGSRRAPAADRAVFAALAYSSVCGEPATVGAERAVTRPAARRPDPPQLSLFPL